MRGMLCFAWLTILLGAGPTVEAQEPPRPLRISTAVVPETVTVGDRFRSVLRLDALDAAAEFTQLAVGDTVQPVDSLQVLTGDSPTAVYSLVAWQTGDDLQARVPVRVQLATGEFVTYIVGLRLPVVRSVLPEDTTTLTPRPHRAVFALPLGTGLTWWIWLLLALAALLLAAFLVWRHLRTRSGAMAIEAPRERALREFEELRAAGMVAVQLHVSLYPSVTRILRDYLADVEPRWGRDLTSSELISRVGGSSGQPDLAVELGRLFGHADAVKFGRRTPTAEELAWFWSSAVDLVHRVPRQPSQLETTEVAA